MRKINAIFAVSILALATLPIILSSCKKPNREFVGTYVGKSKLNGGSDIADTIVITADSANNSDIYVVESLLNFETLDNVNGNDITVPSQSVPIKGIGGTDETLTGSGSLSGSTLTLTFYYGSPMTTIAFTGTKQ